MRPIEKGWNPMSNKMPNDTSLQTTKQMLDELDALMEQMLSLPVNDLEGAAAFPREIVKTPTPMLPPALSAKLTLLEAPAAVAREKSADTPSYLSAPASPLAHP